MEKLEGKEVIKTMGEIKFKTGGTFSGATFTGRVATIEEARQKAVKLAESIKDLDSKAKVSAIYREKLI